MFTSIIWKRGLLALAVVASIALALAKGRDTRSSTSAGTSLMADSGTPIAVTSILRRACADCHSDNTVWPWYADLPPISRRIHGDVMRGRAFMNFSKWGEYSDGERRGYMSAIVMATQARVMPPPRYVRVHGKARLTDTELKVLREWMVEDRQAERRDVGVTNFK